jgi:hypothetical protein
MNRTVIHNVSVKKYIHKTWDGYTLEPLLHGQLYGKPITEKIIVGTDIAIEEEKI